MKYRFVTLLSCFAIGLLTGASAAADTLVVTEHRITASQLDETQPTLGVNLSTDLVVYTQKQSDGLGDIWYQPLLNGSPNGPPIPVTNTPGVDEQLNDVSGDYIVYTSMIDGVVIYRISDGAAWAFANPLSLDDSHIDGNWVTWLNGTDVMLYNLNNLGTGVQAERISSSPASMLQIGDRFVVWVEAQDIVVWDLAGSTATVVGTADNDVTPTTSGAWVAWVAGNSNRIESVNMDDPTLSLAPVVNDGSLNLRPSMNGDLIAWESNAAGNFDIWVYRISTGEAPFQVTTDLFDQQLTDVFGNLVAYVDARDFNKDVWVSTLEFVAPDPCADLGGDQDGDGICTVEDNCPDVANPDQSDSDNDGSGDACDADTDGDGVDDGADNCPFTANPDQSDIDSDGLGNVCDGDPDGDGVADADNCPLVPNPFQEDTDSDGVGDDCDEDDDNDGICDIDEAGASCTAGPDNCATVVNPDQADLDSDNIGDACDADLDGDGIENGADNCPIDTNPGQDDTDTDGAGDVCDADDDNDGVLDTSDNCALIVNPGQTDTDQDGRGDVCDADLDGDGVDNSIDNCPTTANSGQSDWDGDSIGDSCDLDIDGDGVANDVDACSATPIGDLVHQDNGCSIAQLCPCDGQRGTTVPWKNHGKYVSCRAHAANDFLSKGLITDAEKDAIMSEAGQSACGNKK